MRERDAGEEKKKKKEGRDADERMRDGWIEIQYCGRVVT